MSKAWLPEKAIISFIVSLALFMEVVDTTILNTAIPAMARSFDVNPINLKIALISYLLSLSIFIPVSGWMADKYGIKRVFISALAVFTLSSIGCGLSQNIPELVFARVLQGLGGAFMMPVGRLILALTFERHELIYAMSRVVMVVALGMMLGPVLGGFITHYLSWHWIFWVNIPIGIINIVLALHWLKAIPPQTVPTLDKLGFVLFGTGLAGLTFGLSAFSESSISMWVAGGIMMAAIFLLLGYILHSRKIKHPIVKNVLFTKRSFRISTIGSLVSRIGVGGVPFLLPLLFQLGLGYTAQVSGLLLAPTALGVLIIKPFALPLLRLCGYKRLLMLNSILVASSLWAFMIINSHTPMAVIALLTFLFGFLISLQWSCMNSLGYSDIKAAELSAATSIMSTTQQLSQSFGVAVGALLVRFFTPDTAVSFLLTTPVFHAAFFMLGLITLLSMFLFIRLKPGDGEQMLNKKISATVPIS
jgi:EmrB/QacA subfamily drug resistance transporter